MARACAYPIHGPVGTPSHDCGRAAAWLVEGVEPVCSTHAADLRARGIELVPMASEEG
jgi:hypothetical protein